MSEHIGVIEEAGFKPKKDPSKGNNFCVKVSGWERYYYINKKEDKHLQDKATELLHKTVKVTYEEDGGYRNPSAIEEVAPALNTPVSANGEGMSKVDWVEVAYREECAKCINSFIAIGHFATPVEAIKWYTRLVNRDYGEVSQIPATKPQEGKQAPSPLTKEQVAQIGSLTDKPPAVPPISTKDKPAVAAAQGVPISQLPVEQIMAELWPHLWRTHKITKSKVAELKGWMKNALKDSGFPVPESMDTAKPEQIYAMGEYARREAQGATK